MINYALFPLPRSVKVVKAYIERGEDPGQFRHIVENDLINCMTSIDEDWLPCLHSLVLWFFTQAPAHCLGNKENVRLWEQRGGREGIHKQRSRSKIALAYALNISPYTRYLDLPIEPTD
ncbi:hypothetical protein N9980_00855 [bacterium]|nr:hypothetical protein [bacterium]